MFKDCEHLAIACLSIGDKYSLKFGLSNLEKFAWIGVFSLAPNTKIPQELFSDPAKTKKMLKLL